MEAVLPGMLARGSGHIVGLPSLADSMANPKAPSYSASKAGMSCWLEGLALALRPRGLHVTNIRSGFVDTKMAKSELKPFLIRADKAAKVVLRCLRRRPIRCTYPWRMAALLWLVSWPTRIRLLLS